ncbi:MAG: restriction endonuclease [Halobacteriales archaeon]|nr:restriction endonuclease [Halobacteriales archaeon]
MLTEPEREEIRGLMEQVDPIEFEHFVAFCFEADGWTTSVTREGGDEGIDFIAEQKQPVPQRVPVQVKHREESENRLGSDEIRQYQALDQQHQSYTACMVAANTTFTPQAKGVAYDRQEFSLFDVDDLIDLIEKHDLEDELRMAVSRDLSSGGDTGTDYTPTQPSSRGTSKPALPSPTAVLKNPLSPAQEDRWRNVITISILVGILSLVPLVYAQPNPDLRWLFQLSGWVFIIMYLLSTYSVWKDIKHGTNLNIIGRFYGTVALAVIPFIGPYIYLKLRKPSGDGASSTPASSRRREANDSRRPRLGIHPRSRPRRGLPEMWCTFRGY